MLLLMPLLLGTPIVWGEISIQNDQQYIGDDGTLHIVGEIKNDLDVPLNQIEVYALLYSESNELINTITSKVLVNNIMPGMKSPFDIIVLENSGEKIDNYSLDFDYKVSSPKNQVIDITSSELSRDTFDNLVITGTVANKGEITANTISVIATLYDKDGNVAAVSKIQTEPDYLRSSDEAFFLLSLPDKAQTTTVVDYSLVAESEEYAAVPEFPLGSGILLVSSVFGYILITKIWKNSITNLVAVADLR